MKKPIFLLFIVLIIRPVFADPVDSTYIRDPYFQKLLRTQSKVPLFYNEQVRQQIGVYIRNLNNSTATLIGKAQYYKQLLGAEFDSAGLPGQLFLAAAVYSGFDPVYSGEDGGSGMWALTYAIAKKYELRTNSYIDERRNPVRSTRTAASYFTDLNVIYQDWLKTLVAFRTGPINFNMAIHRASNSLDYSNIHNQLSAEYQEIAVKSMAFWYIWNHYNEHRIVPVRYKLPDTDTVHVLREIGLNAVSHHLNLSLDVLRLCNSELRLDIVPLSYNDIGLRLPKDKVELYRSMYVVMYPPDFRATADSGITDSLVLEQTAYSPRINMQNDSLNTGDEDDEDEHPVRKPAVPATPAKITLIYVVKKGDGLLLLADVFDCRVSDIRKWNGMKKNNIYIGQKLKIKVPKNKAAQYRKINSMTMTQKKRLAQKS